MTKYEKLDAWKLCHELTLQTYRVTAGFPRAEAYGLTSQARRAAIAIGANIAEGMAKRGPKEFRRFLDISLGSMAELGYLLRCARDLGFLDSEAWQRVESSRCRAAAVTWA